MQSDSYLFWLDLEMSGLNSDFDTILEIACLITDNNLEVIAEGPCLVVSQPDFVLDNMDDWNKITHGDSGLIDRVKKSRINLANASEMILKFLKRYCIRESTPLCGNSIHQDRAFLRRLMPEIDRYLHYRNIDVTTIKELVHRWYPNDPCVYFKKELKHRALDDVYESIDELRHYRKFFFRPIP